MLSIVLLVGSLSAQTAQTPNTQTPNKAVPAQGPPPKKLTVRPDGHVTANQDPDNPDKFEVHIVMKGETLSQIAGVALKNPRLWPQLWEQNEHIINPHWIYPDDKILIRPVTPLAEAKPPEHDREEVRLQREARYQSRRNRRCPPPCRPGKVRGDFFRHIDPQ